jgi:hypothetical protein
MIRAAGIVLASCLLVPAAAGTSTARPAIALTASPARVTLLGSGQASIQLRNTGSRPVVVDVARAGFALDLRGRPRIVPRGRVSAADSWLTVRPGRLALASGARTSLTVAVRLPRRVEPGDHDALVLLTTRPRQAAGVAVRMRVGVLVIVRAPGRIVRRLELGRLAVRSAGRARMLELLVVNRGNLTETLPRSLVAMTLRRRGRVQARLRCDTRQLRPRTKGIVQFRYRGRLRGWVTAEVTVSLERGATTRRTYRIRL